MAVGTYMDAEHKAMAATEVHERLHAGYMRRLSHPVQRPARSAKTLWVVNFGLGGLVLLAGAFSYAKHHPGVLPSLDAQLSSVDKALTRSVDEELALGSPESQRSELARNTQASKHHDPTSDTKAGKHMWHASQETNPPLPPPTEDHGILPRIPIKYLPFVIVGFMLMVPILTISVLKGCWAMIDLFVPMQGAPQPDNYARRKIAESDADLEAGLSAAGPS